MFRTAELLTAALIAQVKKVGPAFVLSLVCSIVMIALSAVVNMYSVETGNSTLGIVAGIMYAIGFGAFVITLIRHALRGRSNK